MTTISIPLTTYSVRQVKPSTKYGSPAALPLRTGAPSGAQVFARVPLDKVPSDATITSAHLHLFSDRAQSGTITVQAAPVTSAWKSSITWSTRPTVGAVLGAGAAMSGVVKGTLFDLDVSSWALSRPRNGLRITATITTANAFLAGSSAPSLKPVVVVDYLVPPDQPANLEPDGGIVSVAQPILTYAGDADMTSQQVQLSSDGITPTWTSDPVPATTGWFDPATATPAPVPVPAQDTTIYWRVQTTGPNGTSMWSDWASYSWHPLPVLALTDPPANPSDGSPPFEWTVNPATQTQYRTAFTSGGSTVDAQGWTTDAAAREWVPGRSVKVPGGVARAQVWVRDDQAPRVAAPNAPAEATAYVDLTTVRPTPGTVVDSLAVAYAEPVPVISGLRSAGPPDYLGLYRDGVQVPVWTSDGAPGMWAPGTDVFAGDVFHLPDYTAEPRHTHTWQVASGVLNPSTGKIDATLGSRTVTFRPTTDSVWLVDPATGDRVEVLGYGDAPAIDQATDETSILHVPINGGPVIEAKRRRVVRTTRYGSIQGTVLNEAEQTLTGWVEADSGRKYRLVFGKVNWSVILGDYSPQDTFYPDDCGPDRVLVACNFWQRLADY